MTVVDSGGATIGTVTGIHTVGNGKVRSVQVTLTDGQIINLSPRSLTVDGDVLATTSLTSNVNSQGAAHANINGLINASPNSALAMAGVTTLTGLTTGLTVEGSARHRVAGVRQQKRRRGRHPGRARRRRHRRHSGDDAEHGRNDRRHDVRPDWLAGSPRNEKGPGQPGRGPSFDPQTTITRRISRVPGSTW
jgi:hypothetical protein